MLDKVEYSKVKKYRTYFPYDINSNSYLYLKKGVIYKIPAHVGKDFPDILKYIDECNLDELIELKNLIYEDDKFVGYSFKKYNGYKSLRRSKYLPPKLKLERCFKMMDYSKVLNDRDIIYHDFHLGNILGNKKNQDLKVCDLDSIEINGKDLDKIKQIKNFLMLSLAYLYGVTYHDIHVLLRTGNRINNDELVDRYDNINSVEDAIDILKNIDLECINKEKIKIKSKSWKLSNTGYFEFDHF